MNTTKPKIIRYEDAEGQGVCGICQREGLRWVAVLDSGAVVGRECALKVTGQKMPPVSTFSWVGNYELVAEHQDCQYRMALWQRRGGSETRETANGVLVSVGGARKDWETRGWL